MRWLNIAVETFQKVEFTQAEPAEVGCWLRLFGFCAAQENGGLIHDCRRWDDRQWLIAAGLMKADLHRPAKLWTWTKNGGLRIAHYPEKKEREVSAKREAGKRTAGMRWGKPKKPKPDSSSDSSAISSANCSSDAEGKRKRKGKGITAVRATRTHAPQPVNGAVAHTHDDQPTESREQRP